MVGASLLWVGWFGFNAGSNLEANGYASLAMINTFVATAAAAHLLVASLKPSPAARLRCSVPLRVPSPVSSSSRRLPASSARWARSSWASSFRRSATSSSPRVKNKFGYDDTARRLRRSLHRRYLRRAADRRLRQPGPRRRRHRRLLDGRFRCQLRWHCNAGLRPVQGRHRRRCCGPASVRRSSTRSSTSSSACVSRSKPNAKVSTSPRTAKPLTTLLKGACGAGQTGSADHPVAACLLKISRSWPGPWFGPFFGRDRLAPINSLIRAAQPAWLTSRKRLLRLVGLNAPGLSGHDADSLVLSTTNGQQVIMSRSNRRYSTIVPTGLCFRHSSGGSCAGLAGFALFVRCWLRGCSAVDLERRRSQLLLCDRRRADQHTRLTRALPSPTSSCSSSACQRRGAAAGRRLGSGADLRQPHVHRVPARRRLVRRLGRRCRFHRCFPAPPTWPLPNGLGGVFGDMILRFPALFTGTYPTGSLRTVLGVLFSRSPPPISCCLQRRPYRRSRSGRRDRGSGIRTPSKGAHRRRRRRGRRSDGVILACRCPHPCLLHHAGAAPPPVRPGVRRKRRDHAITTSPTISTTTNSAR